jgi:uncharacterized membrane protein
MNRSRAALAAFFTLAGTMHFLRPSFYEAIVPPAVGNEREVVIVSGLAELAGAAAVLHPRSRRLGRWWLLALLVAVFPANLHLAVNPEQVEGLDLERAPRWALWARLPLQPLAMLWVWRATRS